MFLSRRAPPLSPNGRNGPRARFGIARLSVLGVVTAGAVLLVASAITYHIYRDVTERYLQQRVEHLATEVAFRFADVIQENAVKVEIAAHLPYVMAALSARSQSDLADAEKVLRQHFPGAKRVRLILANDKTLEPGTFPELGYADLDMLAQAERNGKPPVVEAHLMGTAEGHIDIMRPVMIEKSRSERVLIGHLIVSFGSELVQRALERLQVASGYIEVRQLVGDGAGVLLAALGKAADIAAGATRTTPVAGTLWTLSYWPPAEERAAIVWRERALWVIFAVVFVLLAVIAATIHFVLSKALEEDLETLVDVVRDARVGLTSRPRYTLRIREFVGTVEALSAMGSVPPAPPSDDTSTAAVVPPPPAPAAAAAPPQAATKDYFTSLRGPEQENQPQRSQENSTMDVPDSIFRAYDIRGVVGDTLTEEVVYDIGRALGSEAFARGQQTVLVGRDGRLSGPRLAESLSNGLRDAGRDVIDIGMVPTPVLYFATHYLNAGSGVMVTGSHNPPEYNGLKMVLKGDTLAEDDIQSLKRRIQKGDFTRGNGTLERQDIVGDYIETIVGDVTVARPLNVVVDCGNGVAGVAAPRLLRALGCNVTELYCDVDGSFPHHHPDPSQPENLQDLIRAVQTQGADIGLAFDGDGDRLGVIDAAGHTIWPDRQMMLYARDVLSRNPGAQIIFDVKCSRNLSRDIAQHGGRPMMWRTGHSLIKRKMKETGALLAGEMSGHIFFKERWFGFDDALYTAARLVEILAKENRPPREVFAALPDAVATPELRIELPEGTQQTFMNKLLEQAEFEGAALTTIDGLRADFQDGWGLVRASNTTPALILRFEANNRAALERIQSVFRALLVQVDPDLRIPF